MRYCHQLYTIAFVCLSMNHITSLPHHDTPVRTPFSDVEWFPTPLQKVVVHIDTYNIVHTFSKVPLYSTRGNLYQLRVSEREEWRASDPEDGRLAVNYVDHISQAVLQVIYSKKDNGESYNFVSMRGMR